MPRRVKPRAPKRAPVEMTTGQLGMFGSDEPWQPTLGCRCWPIDLRGCQHCRTCDGCLDCGRCAGIGCSCACQEQEEHARSLPAPGEGDR